MIEVMPSSNFASAGGVLGPGVLGSEKPLYFQEIDIQESKSQRFWSFGPGPNFCGPFRTPHCYLP